MVSGKEGGPGTGNGFPVRKGIQGPRIGSSRGGGPGTRDGFHYRRRSRDQGWCQVEKEVQGPWMVSSRGEGLGARDGFQKKRRFRDQGLVPEEEGVRDRGISLIWVFEFQSRDQGWFPVTGEEGIQGLEMGG